MELTGLSAGKYKGGGARGGLERGKRKVRPPSDCSAVKVCFEYFKGRMSAFVLKKKGK